MLGLRLLFLSKYKVILTCLKKKGTLYVAMKKPNVHSGPMLIKEDGSLWKTRTLIHLLLNHFQLMYFGEFYLFSCGMYVHAPWLFYHIIHS